MSNCHAPIAVVQEYLRGRRPRTLRAHCFLRAVAAVILILQALGRPGLAASFFRPKKCTETFLAMVPRGRASRCGTLQTVGGA